MNSCWEPERGEIVTLLVLLDKGVEPFSQVMSMSVTDMVVSVAELKEMVQVKVRGAVLPAYSGPPGIVTSISGVETGGKGLLYNNYVSMISIMQIHFVGETLYVCINTLP